MDAAPWWAVPKASFKDWEEQDGIAEGFARFDRQPTPRWLDPVYSDIVENTLIIAQHPVVIDSQHSWRLW